MTPSLRLVINWDAREPFANAPGAETYRRETIESRFPERIIPEECCSTQLGLSLTPPRRSAVGGNTRRLAVPGAPAAERRKRSLWLCERQNFAPGATLSPGSAGRRTSVDPAYSGRPNTSSRSMRPRTRWKPSETSGRGHSVSEIIRTADENSALHDALLWSPTMVLGSSTPRS